MTATHHSPNYARRCLTLVNGHKHLFSTRYVVCQLKCFWNVYISSIIFLVYFLTRARTAQLRYYQRSLHCTYITLRGAFIVHLSIFILHSVVPETQCSSPRLEGSLYCISMFLVPEAQWSSHHLERGLYCISRYVCSTRSLTDQRSCKTLDADFWANILTWYWLNCWTESTTEVGPEWVNLIQSAMERPHSGPTAVVTAVQPLSYKCKKQA